MPTDLTACCGACADGLGTVTLNSRTVVTERDALKTRLAAVETERDTLAVVADQFGVPTTASLLADTTAQLLCRMQQAGQDRFAFGLYHLVPSGETNWHEYACFVLREALQAGIPLKLQPQQVRAITSAEYPLPAKRPANSRLDTTRLRRSFDLTLPDWQSGVQKLLQEIFTQS